MENKNRNPEESSGQSETNTQSALTPEQVICSAVNHSRSIAQQIELLSKQVQTAAHGVAEDQQKLEQQMAEALQLLNRIESVLAKSGQFSVRLKYIEDAVKNIYRKQFIDRDKFNDTHNILLKLHWLRQPFPRVCEVWSLFKRALVFAIREPRNAVNHAFSLVWSHTPTHGQVRQIAKPHPLPTVIKKEPQQTVSTIPNKLDEAADRVAANARTLREYSRALKQYCEEHPDYPLVILNSTAKPINETLHITYRSTFMLRELEKSGYPSVFSYYNWDENPLIETEQTLPVIELPADGLLAFAPHLAKLAVPNKKLFLCGIPDFRSAQLIEILRRSGFCIAYDCWDEHELFAQMDLARWYNKSVEQFVAQNSDFVFAVCPPLLGKLVERGVDPLKAHVSNNGIRLDQAASDICKTLTRRKTSNIFGYVGNLSARWFDWNAVVALALAMPTYRVELVGPNAEPPLNLPKNVYLLGPMTNEEAFMLSAEWRAGIIPHINNEHIQHADSIKVYEFLGAGLPIISIHKEFLEDYPMTFTYRNSDLIVEAVQAALVFETSDEFEAEYNDFIRQHSWAYLVHDLLLKSGVIN